jgi:hypothetical protein
MRMLNDREKMHWVLKVDWWTDVQIEGLREG